VKELSVKLVDVSKDNNQLSTNAQELEGLIKDVVRAEELACCLHVPFIFLQMRG
jgi:hypothetical protein